MPWREKEQEKGDKDRRHRTEGEEEGTRAFIGKQNGDHGLYYAKEDRCSRDLGYLQVRQGHHEQIRISAVLPKTAVFNITVEEWGGCEG